jgi:ABC-type multidrug transport system ATPase subunit
MVGLIELYNVSFSAQSGKIVQNISIEFDEARTTAIVGPSGGGKSTVLKLAAGLLVPDQGVVLYKGENVAHMNRSENLQFRREGAFVFQDSALWANQDLFQILELPLRIHFPAMDKKEREQRIKSAVADVGYKKDLWVRPARLSMGEQKLIGFAGAMLCNPSLLYLDEWTESLDESGRVRLMNMVKKKQREGATVVLVRQYMSLIIDIADIVVVIKDGQVSFKATKEQLAKDTELSNYLKMEIGA